MQLMTVVHQAKRFRKHWKTMLYAENPFVLEISDKKTTIPRRSTAPVISASAAKWHMFTLKWQRTPVAVVIMMEAKKSSVVM